MSATKIEWATHTSNWLAGCTKVSPACAHCYAEAMTCRMASGLSGQSRYHSGVVDLNTRQWTGRIAYDEIALWRAFRALNSARKPRRVFCGSMSDLFHDDAPPESLADLAKAIRMLGNAHGHVIMLLTKRPGNLLAWQHQYFPAGLPPWVWVGCTVEDQQRADERVRLLLQVKAAVRFVSCEPLLGPVNLHTCDGYSALLGSGDLAGTSYGLGAGPALAWVIAGGESGPNARPSHPDWFRGLRDQCKSAGVPFMLKGWGRYVPGGQLPDETWAALDRAGDPPHEDGMYALGKKLAGRILDGRTWDESPEVTP